MIHYQNLKDRFSSHLIHARAWIGDMCIEWLIKNAGFGLKIFGKDAIENQISFNFRIGVFGFYINIPIPYKICAIRENRACEFYWNENDNSLTLMLWGDPYEWNRHDNFIRRGVTLHFENFPRIFTS